MHTSEQKKKLREDIADRLGRMTDEERHAEGRSVCRRLLQQIPEGSTICGYFPLKTEADIRPLMLSLLERGDSVFLPCFDGKKLTFRKVTDLKDLPLGTLGIPEPPADAESVRANDLDIVLVPGRAFDRACSRLGRGNGGYDRWIAGQRVLNQKTKMWGVCLECQIVSGIPLEKHDEPMDAVFTARDTFERQKD